jgi:hypothetical protein
MSRLPTPEEMLEALRSSPSRLVRRERAWKARLAGWSHQTALGIAHGDENATALLDACAPARKVYGVPAMVSTTTDDPRVSYPMPNPVSGRIRRDVRPCPTFDARYRQT